VEVILGIVIPVIIFLHPRFRKNPRALVVGAFLAALGLVFSRWNVTVSGLIVPLNYALGTLFQVSPADYFPSLIEWGVIIGVLGYVMLLFTVAVYFLPIFEYEDGEAH
jgi:molybdopterin-containing oxidoreductase family membrane subunit